MFAHTRHPPDTPPSSPPDLIRGSRPAGPERSTNKELDSRVKPTPHPSPPDLIRGSRPAGPERSTNKELDSRVKPGNDEGGRPNAP
ncbi:hypothetical protein GCM10007972_17230 [Iodidimonas muriae]|uniref:Uncharacterized protein n=1 Tax=Iodidimonas muriae TaxID=261467 RepID=A0ABQ2LDT2_9PROT|nr:hypothetical protein GCM10007972_17230 [Iodidimonas muriae]